MQLLIPATISVLAYLLGAVLQTVYSLKQKHYLTFDVVSLGVLAIVTHGFLLYRLIDQDTGQNLTIVNLWSQICWFMVCITFLLTWRKPIASISLFSYPLAAFSIVLAWLLPDEHIVYTATHHKDLFHILLSILTLSILLIAGLAAFLHVIQEYLLHHKANSILVRAMPPLDLTETFMYRVLALGFILLTFNLLSSFWFFPDSLDQAHVSKIALTLTAWVVFAVLLSGHYCFGWRRQIAMRWTLVGIVILLGLLFLSPH